MPTCGYTCPLCEGRGYLDTGEVCDWCSPASEPSAIPETHPAEQTVLETPLLPGKFYHIYNRGNNRENLFYSEENYRYFLHKYDLYLSDYLDTYAYSLMPNHFHLMVRVKEEVVFRDFTDAIAPSDGIRKIPKKSNPSKIISEQFRRFFISYSQSINKQEGRVGSLFQKPFKRKLVDSDEYGRSLVAYIHCNPQMHTICLDFSKYPHSSYLSLLSQSPTALRREEVMQLFAGVSNFETYHLKHMNRKIYHDDESWIIE